MSKNKKDLLNELQDFYEENSKPILEKCKTKPKKENVEEFDIYKKIKKENFYLLSANDKIYKFILIVLSLAIFVNLTILVEFFYQETVYTKTILSAFTLFLILVFLGGVVFYSYLTDKLIVLNKYQEFYLKNEILPETIKYKVKKEFEREVVNLFDLRKFLTDFKKGSKF